MKIIHLQSPNQQLNFDKERKYVFGLNEMKPNGLWCSPEKSLEDSYTFADWAKGEINYDFEHPHVFELSDDVFVNYGSKCSPDKDKILVITPEDLSTNNKERKRSSIFIDYTFCYQYGGVMIRPYSRKMRLKYIWYNIYDGESLCIWNLDLLKDLK